LTIEVTEITYIQTFLCKIKISTSPNPYLNALILEHYAIKIANKPFILALEQNMSELKKKKRRSGPAQRVNIEIGVPINDQKSSVPLI
jgi:hypothetical protein